MGKNSGKNPGNSGGGCCRSCCRFFLYGFVAVVAVVIGGGFLAFNTEEKFPHPLPDFYWGPKGKAEDISIRPFKIQVDKKDLDDLKGLLTTELKSKRWTAPLENIGFQYGVNSESFKTVLNHWANKYDWRAREKLLNQYPHFKTRIAGLDIHFQHVKSPNNAKYKKTRPLLLLHGWPGSFVEFQKMIPLLTEPKDLDINFELVIPSLPGYGFSEGAVRPGMGPLQMGVIFQKLMQRLGYDKFYIQGGDWGSAVGTGISQAFPGSVHGFHTNLCMSMSSKSVFKLLIANNICASCYFTPEEAALFLPSTRFLKFLIEETGYMHIQGTKPDTVGFALGLSPSGLAAYLLEKFSGWTNQGYKSRTDGGLTAKFTLDELLDNVMVYWVSNSITTSMRLYSEAFGPDNRGGGRYNADNVPITVPTGCIVPRNEPYASQPKSIVQDQFKNLVTHSYAEDGGHFFAMEHPQVLAKDVIHFAKLVESPPPKK